MKLGLVLLSVSLVRDISAKVDFTTLTEICDAKDPQLDDCFLDITNKILPVLSKGIKDYGFTPIDPMLVPKMEVGQEDGPVTLALELTDTVHTGLSSYKAHSAKVDLDNGYMFINGTVQNFDMQGHYKGKGHILVIPIIGDGHANLTFRGTGMEFHIYGAPTRMKGETYFKLKDVKLKLIFREAHLDLSNLFNGNEILGKTTNKYLNENSLEVFTELKDTLADVFGELYKGVLQRLFANVPYNKLFKNV